MGEQNGDRGRKRKNLATAAAKSTDAYEVAQWGLGMSTVLFVIGVLIGTVALVVLAALLHGAASYLNSRWRSLNSDSRKQKPSMRNHTVGP